MRFFRQDTLSKMTDHWKAGLITALVITATVAGAASAQLIENSGVFPAKPIAGAPFKGHEAPVAVPEVLGTKTLKGKPVNQGLIEQIKNVRDSATQSRSSTNGGINLH